MDRASRVLPQRWPVFWLGPSRSEVTTSSTRCFLTGGQLTGPASSGPGWPTKCSARSGRVGRPPFGRSTGARGRWVYPNRFQRGTSSSFPKGDVVIVDLIGLLHPEIDDVLDLKIWCDVDLATATAWGKARDARFGRAHDRLWDEVWVPNEIDFVGRFDPRRRADVILAPLPLFGFADN